MKYFSSKFEEYINDCKKYNMHKKMSNLYDKMSMNFQNKTI